MTQTQAIVTSTQLPAHLADVGALGNENIDATTLATPRLMLLQALSPQAIRGNAEYVPNAQAGQFLNSITKELSDELWVANLFMTRGFNVNKKREFGQRDWRGFFDTIEAAIAKLNADRVVIEDYDIQDTHVHTLAIVNPVTGVIVTPIQYSMRGSALKDSRTWNSNIVTHGTNVPRFSSIWKLEPKLNTNAKGSWYTPQASFAGWAPDTLFASLTELYHSLRQKTTSNDFGDEM